MKLCRRTKQFSAWVGRIVGSTKLFCGPFFVLAVVSNAPERAFASCRVFHDHQVTGAINTDRAFSYSMYNEWKRRWEFQIESGSDVFRTLKDHHGWRAEVLISLLDAFNRKQGLDLVDSVRTIENLGDKVEIRRYRFARAPTVNGFRVELSRRDQQSKTRWFFGLNRKLVLYLPELAPQNPAELADSLKMIAFSITNYRLKRAGRRAPRLSTPIGPWSFSYPRSVMEIVLDAAARLYAGLAALENRFPQWNAKLPRRDRTWNFLFEELTFATGWRFLFPFFFEPLKKARPNEEDYNLFKRDVELWLREDSGVEFPPILADRFPSLNEALVRKFQFRTRLKWASDRWKDFIIVSSLMGVIRYVPAAYEFVKSGELQRIYQEVIEFQDSVTPENINRALERYEGTLAWKFYGPKIEALQKDIRENGDFDGSKRQELKGLIERLEKLK